VGMYDAKTGERLPVTLADGQQVPERWIILQKIRIEGDDPESILKVNSVIQW